MYLFFKKCLLYFVITSCTRARMLDVDKTKCDTNVDLIFTTNLSLERDAIGQVIVRYLLGNFKRNFVTSLLVLVPQSQTPHQSVLMSLKI